MKLSVYYTDGNGNYVAPFFEIDVIHKITVIRGDSGIGKSWTVNVLSSIAGTNRAFAYKCSLSVQAAVNEDQMLMMADTLTNNIIIADEDVVAVLRKHKNQYRLEKSSNYFVLISRDDADIWDLNIEALMNVNRINNGEYAQIVCSQMFKSSRIDINDSDVDRIKYFISEDSKSGRIFWANILKDEIKLYPEDIHGDKDRPSSSKVLNFLDEIAETLNDEDLVLVSLDYDRGAKVLLKMIETYSEYMNHIRFVPLESFEEIVCNSEFILGKFPEMKDYVVNYKNYLDYRYASTGKYFSSLLFNFVKVKNPVNTGDRNITKFYYKNMKNFRECFIDDCCSYDRDQDSCKLYYDSDKKRVLLNNKFEPYQKLMK